MLGSLGRPFEDLWSFAALGGSSSSSLSRVRSTTWPTGRLFPDVDAGGGAEDVDCSLDDMGGVLSNPGSRDISHFTEASRGISRISTKSSSPSLLARPLDVLGGEGALLEV